MKSKNLCILIIDDSPADRRLMELALRRNGVTHPIQCVSSGEEAIAYLEGEGKFSPRSHFPYPSFIITDLKMPHGDGFSVLDYLKRNLNWAIIPTIVFSGSCDPDDIKKSYLLGASSYLVKPGVFEELTRLLGVLYAYWQECEVPQVDATGRMLATFSTGKLGERFPQPDDTSNGTVQPNEKPT